MAIEISTSEGRIGKKEHSFTYDGYSFNWILRTFAYYEQRSTTVARIHFRMTVENTTSNTWYGTNKKYTLTLGGSGVPSQTSWANQIPANSGQIEIKNMYLDLSPNTTYKLKGTLYVEVLGYTWECSDDIKTPAFVVAPTTPTSVGTSDNPNVIKIDYGTTSFGNPSSGTVYLYGGTSSNPTTLIASKTTTGNSTFTWSGRTANTYYYDRARAYNGSAYSSYSADDRTLTPCAAPSSISVYSQSYTAYNKVSATINITRADDGGSVSSRTVYYRYKTGSGSWSSYINAGTLANNVYTKSVTITNLATSSTIYIEAYLNNGKNSATKSFNFTTKTTHTAPNFSNFTYQDTNASTVALTGNNQTMIQGQSTPKITISTSNKATGNDGIAVTSYGFNFSGRSDTASWSSSSAVEKTLGTPVNSGSQVMTVSATDALSLSKSVTKTVTVYPWSTPVINASVTRTNNFENETTIKISGTWSPITISSVNKNTLTVDYRYKKSSTSAWGAWENRQITITGSNYTTTDLVGSFDNDSQWDFQIRATDQFTTKTVSITLSAGIPTFFVGDDGRVSVGARPTYPLATNEISHIETKGQVVIYSDKPFVVDPQYNSGTYYRAIRTDTNTEVEFGVGSGGYNHGVWSVKQNRWLLHGDASDLFLGGTSVLTASGATDLTINNINLNSTQYFKVGKYYCRTAAVGSTQSNNPSASAYQMIVFAPFDFARELSGYWVYMARMMFAVNGVWYQIANTNASGEVSYGGWRQLHNS